MIYEIWVGPSRGVSLLGLPVSDICIFPMISGINSELKENMPLHFPNIASIVIIYP